MPESTFLTWLETESISTDTTSRDAADKEFLNHIQQQGAWLAQAFEQDNVTKKEHVLKLAAASANPNLSHILLSALGDLFHSTSTRNLIVLALSHTLRGQDVFDERISIPLQQYHVQFKDIDPRRWRQLNRRLGIDLIDNLPSIDESPRAATAEHNETTSQPDILEPLLKDDPYQIVEYYATRTEAKDKRAIVEFLRTAPTSHKTDLLYALLQQEHDDTRIAQLLHALEHALRPEHNVYVPFLVDMTRRPDRFVRAAAVKCLAYFNDDGVLSPLLQAARDEEEHVRDMAAVALSSSPRPVSHEHLSNWLETFEDCRTRFHPALAESLAITLQRLAQVPPASIGIILRQRLSIGLLKQPIQAIQIYLLLIDQWLPEGRMFESGLIDGAIVLCRSAHPAQVTIGLDLLLRRLPAHLRLPLRKELDTLTPLVDRYSEEHPILAQYFAALNKAEPPIPAKWG